MLTKFIFYTYDISVFTKAIKNTSRNLGAIFKIRNIIKVNKKKITVLRSPKSNKNSREVFIKFYYIIEVYTLGHIKYFKTFAIKTKKIDLLKNDKMWTR